MPKTLLQEAHEDLVGKAVSAERKRCAEIAERKAEHLADSYAQVCRDIAEAINSGEE